MALAAEHHPGLIARLLEGGARPESADAPRLLMLAIGDGSPERVTAARALVSRGVSADAKLENVALLEHAINRGKRDAARGLIQLGADHEKLLQAAAAALRAGRHADAYEVCSLVADAIDSRDAAWLCAQAKCGLGDQAAAQAYAARSPQDRQHQFEELCANMSP